MNNSPWLEQLDPDRPIKQFNKPEKTDVVIVGGGIAGVSTAYFLLKLTDKKVILVEGGKLAHGATGHNAGQVLSFLEKPFAEMVEEYGEHLTVKAWQAMHDSWELLDEIYEKAQLKTPLHRVPGHSGYCTLEEVMEVLFQNEIHSRVGLETEQMMISKEAPFLKEIPKEYKYFYTVVPQSTIEQHLNVKGSKYLAIGTLAMGCMNSALFTEELAVYLLKNYPDRLQIFEKSMVSKIVLDRHGARVIVNKHALNCEKVVLCTNGSTNFSIINSEGGDINGKHHDNVMGVVGYMAAFKEQSDKEAGAFAYFEGQYNQQEPYFYMTRRPYNKKGENLIAIGGPENILQNRVKYTNNHGFPEHAKKSIENFVKENLSNEKEVKLEYNWHGLMGYTKTRLRLIGPERRNHALLYNLGCNGIGILPSIYGGKRVAQFILRKKLSPMVFDP